MNALRRLFHAIESQPAYGYAFVFVVALLTLTYIQLDPTFADPDSFYHAKMALVMRDTGPSFSFPWLSATSLRFSFVDHQFLYHLILIPFVSWMMPLVGIKVATVVFGSIAVVTFCWLLRQLGVKMSWVYGLLLLTINPFVFRLGLAKTQPLVFIVLMFGIWCVCTRRPLGALAVSFVYVWLYAGWPMVVLLALGYIVVSQMFSGRMRGVSGQRSAARRVGKHNLQLAIAIICGVGAGLVFSPYFPENVAFTWIQTLRIGLLAKPAEIAVGGEWYPYGVLQLWNDAILLWWLVGLAFVALIVSHRRQPVQTWVMLAVSVGFILLTLKSRRYIEYAVPFSLAFVALSFTHAWYDIHRLWLKRVSHVRLAISSVVIGIMLLPVIAVNALDVRQDYRQGSRFDTFAEAGRWLAEHSEAGEVVFHPDWDQFPALFYHNDHNYYLAGLDPRFFYLSDPAHYQDWVDISAGTMRDQLYRRISRDFGAQYVLVDVTRHAAFDRNLRASIGFSLVYEDAKVHVYRLYP
jgi:hypothetical protein